MRKLNKQQLMLLGLFVLLLTAIAVASQKFLLLTLGHTVYYCQSAINSLSVRIPSQLGIIVASLLGLVVVVSAVKIVLAYAGVYKTRKGLIAVFPKDEKLTDLLEKLHLTNQTFLVHSQKLFAFCFGIRSPKIYLSTALVNQMDERELEAILRHEKYHLDNRDSLTLLIASVTQSLFPFFPLISDLIYNFRVERELRADSVAITALGESQTLLTVLKKLLVVEAPHVLAFSPALGDVDTLEPRIKVLLQKRFSYKKFNPINVFVSLLMIAIISVVIITPVHAVEMHEGGADAMMICLSDDSCARWCQQNKTVKPNLLEDNASHPYSTAH